LEQTNLPVVQAINGPQNPSWRPVGSKLLKPATDVTTEEIGDVALQVSGASREKNSSTYSNQYVPCHEIPFQQFVPRH
jgi:hypothetical protein